MTDQDRERMKGPWIRTSTKRIVNPLALTFDDIDIEDIAHHLACSNRFVGALRTPLSIAQHSVCVARLLAPDDQLYGLLHDASEAYLGDVSKWLKGHPSMAYYREAEDRAQITIYARYGLRAILPEEVPNLEWADRLMVRAEGELGFDVPELIPDNPRYCAVTEGEWAAIQSSIGSLLMSELDWRTAQAHFLLEFKRLTKIK